MPNLASRTRRLQTTKSAPARQKWEHELQNGIDGDLLTEIMQENKVLPQDIPARLERIQKRMAEPKNFNAFFIRYAIGETIEAKVGRKQKKAYWKAVLEGKIE